MEGAHITKLDDTSNGQLANCKIMENCLKNGSLVQMKDVQMNGAIYEDDDSGLDMERQGFRIDQNETSLVETTNNNLKEEQEFFRNFFQLVYEELITKTPVGKSKVINFLHPDELRESFDFAIRDEPESNKKLLQLTQQTVDFSVKPGHPRFFNQLFSGQDLYGLAGTWLTDAVNTSQYTYEVAPVFTLMETEVMQNLRRACGYQKGDGIFCPGGSIANMYAMNLARYKRCPDIKAKGLFACQRLVVFTSEQSHYSIQKGAAFLGLGTDNIKLIKCDESIEVLGEKTSCVYSRVTAQISDLLAEALPHLTSTYSWCQSVIYAYCKWQRERGRMIPAELEKAVLETKAEGADPYFVNGTGGTTVFGAYDPMDAIADICKKYNMWFHIDAAWGGSALLSKKHRHLLKGVERSNSMTWCQHKMMGVPLQCSAFLLRDNEDLLFMAHAAGARYLFQQDKFYDMSYDTGDKSIQCGRKVDALKLWMMWKAKGNSGFEMEINRKFENARYMAQLITERDGFELVTQSGAPNVCFWYIPPSLQGMPHGTEFRKKLHKVAPLIKERMMTTGAMMIGYQPLGQHVNFFRMIYSNRLTTKKDVEWIVNEIERLGYDIVIE